VFAGNVFQMRTPVALCALVSAAVIAIPSTAAAAATPCWKSVITDWSHDQKIDGRYSATCVRQAMQNAPTDLKIYSTIEDDLQAALQKRSVRRLSGVHPAAASIVAPGSSSALSPLVIVLAGLGGLVVIAAAIASVRRHRAAS
jgi:hypothetical protein